MMIKTSYMMTAIGARVYREDRRARIVDDVIIDYARKVQANPRIKHLLLWPDFMYGVHTTVRLHPTAHKILHLLARREGATAGQVLSELLT